MKFTIGELISIYLATFQIELIGKISKETKKMKKLNQRREEVMWLVGI